MSNDVPIYKKRCFIFYDKYQINITHDVKISDGYTSSIAYQIIQNQ